MKMSVNWFISRLHEDLSGEVEVNKMYETFKFELTESSDCHPMSSMQSFLKILPSIYPSAKRIRKRCNGKWLTLYKGIAFKSLHPISISSDFKDILKFLPQTYNVHTITETSIKCITESGYISNGNAVMKTIIFHNDGKWELSVFGRSVNLSAVEINNSFTVDEHSIETICSIVVKLIICEGVVVNSTIQMSRFHILEQFQKSNSNAPKRTLRSVVCNGIVSFAAKNNICKICRVMTYSKSNANKENINSVSQQSSEDDNVERIKLLLKYANPELVNLFIEQSKNIVCDPRGRRWSKSFIGTCLQLFNRSPHAYGLLVSSNILILPSSSTLIMYKNKLKQEPGFDPTIFEWMLHEANRKSIPEEGMVGGLIFDEMSIQSDIQINKNGDVVELVGFTDLGDEGNKCHSLRKGSLDKKLGTHVLQLLFLGITGFRFPFAHFITDNVQASELYGIFWKSVQYLWTYGFHVHYTCMDGAVCNRSFMHLCVGENRKLNYNFSSLSPTTSQSVIFTMDVSHVLKKIRNNIMKSGITQNCTRNLTLQTGQTVQWKMFIDCYKWDKLNSLQLHRKLTDEHLFPDNQQKMRNYLAEDVLNKEMLYLFQQYKNYLGQKGHCLNGVIELLQNTSKIVSIFRDMRPIKELTDSRLQTLQEVSEWFLAWENFAIENKHAGGKKEAKMLMSPQCHEDIQACVQGFIILCRNILKKSNTVYITPGLINSDVIENIFNQQRSTYNGANTNPNALQYRKSINSILVGQNVVSRKSNAGNSVLSSIPFTVEMKSEVRKRKSVPTTKGVSDVKVTRV